MTIDPRWSMGLGLLLALMGYFAGIGGLLTDAGWDPTLAKHVLSYVLIAFGALSTVNTFLAGVPSKNSTTGFLVSPPKPPSAP